MNVNLSIHIKDNDSITASMIRNEDGEDFISLGIQNSKLVIFFNGFGFEGYKNACRALDRMKMAVQEAWNEKNNDRREDSDGNKRGSETGRCPTAEG